MVTYEQAQTANRFQHVSFKGTDNMPLRVRRSGRTQTWKTRHGHFSIPVKWSLSTSFRIDHINAHEWEVAP